MSSQHLDTLDPVPQAPSSYMEVDVRRFIGTIFAWWREIILLALGAAVVGGAIAWGLDATTPPVYRSSADVILARVVSSVNLVETFRTSPEEVTQADASGSSRRAALTNLVRSSAIANAVIAELGDVLSESEHDPAVLLNMVRAETPASSDGRTVSDLIRITVSADNPEKAAEIANSWAKHYVAHINSVYNQVPAETVASVEADLQRAAEEFETAQHDLESYIADSRIGEIQHQIDFKTTLLESYQSVQTYMITSTIDLDREVRAKLFDDVVWAQTEAAYQVFNSQVTGRLDHLTQLYAARDLAQRQLAQAQNLRRQLEESPDTRSTGTVLALQLLTTQVFATVEGSGLPGQLIVDLTAQLSGDNVDPLADAVTLVETLEQYLDQLDGEIRSLSEVLLSGEGYDFIDRFSADNLMVTSPVISQAVTMPADEAVTLSAAIYERYLDLFDVGEMASVGAIAGDAEHSTRLASYIAELIRELQTLQAEFSAEKSQETMLTQRHALAWQTYETLSNKVAELRLARAAANTEVRFGSPAIPSNTPIEESRLVQFTAIAGAMGLILALLVATIAYVMGWSPWFARRQTA